MKTSPYDPFGVNTPDPSDRRNIQKFFQGDEIAFTVKVEYGGEPATKENSRVRCVLKDQRFTRVILWTGTWEEGIKSTDVPGVLRVKLPDALASTMRRGPFLYVVDVTDPIGNARQTIEEGTFLIDYSAGAPLPDVPYRDDV